MTDLRDWLGSRRPPAPMDLGAWLGQASAPEAGLADLGVSALRSARERPGRVRESAFDLLAADALLSYACEEALESDDPVAALEALLVRVTGGA